MKKHPPPSHRPIQTRCKKQKRVPEAGSRGERKRWKKQVKEKLEEANEIEERAKRNGLAAIDRTKLTGHSVMPSSPVPTLGGKYYLDYEFTCKDCGIREVWTGPQQKWWHEEMGRNIEQIAVRCRECRVKERARKDEARIMRERRKN